MSSKLRDCFLDKLITTNKLMTNLIKNQSDRKKKLLIIIAAIVLALAAYYLLTNKSNGSSNNDGAVLGEKTMIVQTQKVLPETVAESIDMSGITEPLEKVEVSPQMSGKVSSIYFKEGDWIEAGQTIGQLEQDQNLLTAKNNAISSLQITQTNLNNLIDSTAQDIRAAEIAIETARIALDSAKTNGDENIKSSELVVEAAEIALSNAEKSLENIEISGDQTVQDSYDSSRTTMQNNLITLNTALTNVGNILGERPGNNNANDAYDDVLGVLNMQSLNNAKNYFPKAKNDYEDLVENINNLSSRSSYEETDLAINSTRETLNSMSQMLFLTRILLDNTITMSGFSSADLAGLKSSVDFDRNSVSAAASSLQAVQQRIINAKLKSDSGNDTTQSAYDSAQTGLEQAEQNLVSVRSLFQSQIDAAQKQLESAEASLENIKKKSKLQIAQAEGQVKTAKGQVNSVQAQLNDTIIAAPVSGTLNQKYIEIGEMAMAGKPIVSIVNIKDLKIEIALTEFDVAKIFVGQEAKIKIAAYPNEEFIGKVYYVGLVADQMSKKFPVKIQLENKDGKIKAGMMADVKIITHQEDGVLVIHKSAVFEDDDGLEKVYLIDNDSRIKITPVKTEAVGKDELKVIEGLVEGDEVVVDGGYGLEEGWMEEME